MRPADLTQIALLGTERQALPSPTPGSPIGDLLAQLDPSARERSLLCAAALSFQHDRVGALLPRAAGPSGDPCPPEQTRRCSPRAATHLLALLGGDHAELLPEWLQLAASTAQLAPAEALPGLLALGGPYASVNMRVATRLDRLELPQVILPVIGERGRWLGRQNPAWAWPAGAAEDDSVWHTAVPATRLVFLQRLRRSDPTRARELLASTWKEDAPEDRASFLRALTIGLSSGDETFLEAALDDKRKEVRRGAADLLTRLPNSAFARRMIERTVPLLKFDSSLISAKPARAKKSKKSALDLTLPTECDKAMQRDGIDPKPPTAMGEKIGWLVQMLEVAPLKTWTDAWQCTPAAIVEASLQGEWKSELFTAWTRAVDRQQNGEWADALLGAALDLERWHHLEPLMTVLAPDAREQRLTEMFAADSKKIRDLFGTLLLLCRHDWSPAFSRAVLAYLRRMTTETSGDWSLRNQLKLLTIYLAPETLPEAATGWDTAAKGWEFWSQGVDAMIAAALYRQDMREALLAKT